MSDTIEKPWTQEQADALNHFQQFGRMHPFTCGSGNRIDAAHLDREGVLFATPNGWICPYCDYRQNWAHDFMFHKTVAEIRAGAVRDESLRAASASSVPKCPICGSTELTLYVNYSGDIYVYCSDDQTHPAHRLESIADAAQFFAAPAQKEEKNEGSKGGGDLTLGSLFAGIGGFDLGFERAGFETVWQVEIDEYCRRVLEKHFPGAERFADIRKCGGHNLKAVDVICGGFPCQDISWAGKRKGIEGPQSSLWREYRRIIGELKPEWVVIENVSRLVSSGLREVLEDLEIIGYDAEWQIIPAWSFGSPQVRKRIFIVAYPVQSRESWRRPCRFGWGECRQGEVGHDGRQGNEKENVQLWAEPNVGRVAHGLPGVVDRINKLGNAVIPQIAQYIAERIKIAMGEPWQVKP
jgi:DNA (cytosine-5)-methyltransferase 1